MNQRHACGTSDGTNVRKKVTHVVRLTAVNEVEGIEGYLREAYQTSLT